MNHNPVENFSLLLPIPLEVFDEGGFIMRLGIEVDLHFLASCICQHLCRSPVGVPGSGDLGLLRHMRLQEFLVVLEHHLKHISVENLGEISLN